MKLDDDIIEDIEKCSKKAKLTKTAWVRRAIRNQKAKDERKAAKK